MEVKTTRFGNVRIEQDDVITFPAGLLGMEACREWVLLADALNPMLGWLQSVERSEVALGVVSPRRFVPDYQVRVACRDLAPIRLSDVSAAQVLTILSKNEHALVLNLKAPIVFNLADRLATQIVAKDNHPMQFEVRPLTVTLRKSA